MKTIYSKVVGSTFYPGAQEIMKELKPEQVLTPVREELNPYDSNAIGLFTTNSQGNPMEKIGHIKKDLAATIAPLMDNKKEVKVFVSEITGRDKANVGCNIRLEVEENEETNV